MSTNFGFKFDQTAVDAEAYDTTKGSQFPVIVWHGKYLGPGSEAGFWTLDRADSDTAPGPYWEPGEVQFGGSPDSPLSSVWKAETLRACVLGVRKRVIIFGEDRIQYVYPWLTKKTDRVAGSYKAHFQIAIALPDSGDRVFQISLKGVGKTKAWGNPESGQFHDSKFPKGVELLLREYAAQASKETGSKIPEYCSFWIDLVPHVNDKGKRVYIDVGHGTHFSSFTADFATGGNTGLDHRFVGMENFLRFQEIRKEDLLDWERAWNKKGESSLGNSDPYAEPEDELLSREAF